MLIFNDEEFRVQSKKMRPKDNSSSVRRLHYRPKNYRNGNRGTVNNSDLRQNAVVKIRYKKLSSTYAKGCQKAHLGYIERDGVGIDGGKAKEIGNSEGREIIEFKKNEDLQFRFILSPEKSGHMDLNEYTRRYMEKMNIYTRYKLKYVAVPHYNTEQNHVHVIISGIDAEGRSVRFSRDKMRHGFRNIARDVATEMIGERDISKEHVKQNYMTKTEIMGITMLDRDIQKVIRDGFLDTKELDKIFFGNDNIAVKNRLAFLKRMRLLKLENGTYKFKNKWKKELGRMGQYSSFKTASSKVEYTHPLNTKLYNPAKDKEIAGIVTNMGMQNELDDGRYLMIETPDGKAFYVPGGKNFEDIKKGQAVAYDGRNKFFDRIRPLKQYELQQLRMKQNQKGFGKAFLAGLGDIGGQGY